MRAEATLLRHIVPSQQFSLSYTFNVTGLSLQSILQVFAEVTASESRKKDFGLNIYVVALLRR